MDMKLLESVLFPFSLFYGTTIALRNFLFDKGILSSQTTKIPNIGVGNLSVGGTGKSVVIDYLISNFKEQYSLVVISRGYKRKTSGVIVANPNSTVHEIGDEPYQFLSKHNVRIIVSEKRKRALKVISEFKKLPDIILFDDIMQHRYITPQCLIVTTNYSKPYFQDHLLPLGRLRESPKQIKRAQIILVNKCPENLSIKDQTLFINKIKILAEKRVYFTTIAYENNLKNKLKSINLNSIKNSFLLITGIANPEYLVNFLNKKEFNFLHLKFPNHHNFKENEIKEIKRQQKGRKIITTEKDFGRLESYFTSNELFYLPIKLKFIGYGKENQFKTYLESILI